MPSVTHMIFNLEFPPHCKKLSIAGYDLVRIDSYKEALQCLQHWVSSTHEFSISAGTGEHAITAHCTADNFRPPYLSWQPYITGIEIPISRLSDVLLILSLLTQRHVFSENVLSIKPGTVITRDSRRSPFGGALALGHPYKASDDADLLRQWDKGFEDEANRLCDLLGNEEWRQKYGNGYFLFLARQAFSSYTVESAFTQCWTLWEHLFCLWNKGILSEKEISDTNGTERISHVLEKSGLYRETIETGSNEFNRLRDLKNLRNELVHFGTLNKHAIKDVVLFIWLTEILVSKALDQNPNDIFDILGALEKFFNEQETQQHLER